MNIKTKILSTSMLLALGLSMPFEAAQAEEEKAVDTAVECISAADIEAMTDEAKANLTQPVCEEAEKTEAVEEPATPVAK